MDSHELLSTHLIKTYRREIPADGLTTVQLTSEQISESFECQPRQADAFKRLLKQSGIELEK